MPHSDRGNRDADAAEATRFVVQRHAALTSTMDEAKRCARAGAADGLVVVAQTQTQGRGRQGRAWESLDGNLLTSLLLRPRLPPTRLTELGFLASLAVADAVDAILAGDRARLKWPNDVLVDGAKVAGILAELQDDAAIIGIGLNVARAPATAMYPVSCLRDLGAIADADAALTTLLASFERWLAAWRQEGFAPIREAWLARGPVLGDAVRLRLGERVTEGRFAGLDSDGALLLAETGGRRRIVAGEIVPGAESGIP
jgi:BirA family transcriptional regulator, biotin operon repressor / biotin---[acetyl-CoA-carboxylase] ligase